MAAVGLRETVRATMSMVSNRVWSGSQAAAASLALALVLAAWPYLSAREEARRPGTSDRHATMLRGDAALEFGAPTAVSDAWAIASESDAGEPVIAPVGFSEAHYIGRFVQDRRTPEDTAHAWALARAGPAWVFMGDNYLRKGSLDDFDRTVKRHGRLVFRSPPVPGFTDPENTIGYALYHLDQGLPPDAQP